jgi:hypothetical protein
VRSSGNLLFAVVPTCNSYPSCPSNTLRVYRANQAGLPTGFAEQDAIHHPTGGIGTDAIAIDGLDVIHVVWLDRAGAGHANYATFDTRTNLWGPTTMLQSTGWTTFGQGDEGVALALDSSGNPHAVWNAIASDGRLHIQYATLNGGTWTAPVRVDDVTFANNHRTWHPTLGFTSAGELVLAWMDGSFNYTPDGTIRIRTRSSTGVWASSAAIPETVMTSIDNGPSLLITPDGVQHLVFVNTGNQIRYWYNAGAGWLGDQQPTAQVTHDPSLGPDGQGGVFIYGHGTPVGGIDGHGNNLNSFHKPAGGAWGAWTLYIAGSFDSSVGTRWSQFFNLFSSTVDILYWSDDYPNVLYAGVN